MVVNSSFLLENANLFGRCMIMALIVFLAICLFDGIKDFGKLPRSKQMKLRRLAREEVEHNEFLYLLYKERGEMIYE